MALTGREMETLKRLQAKAEAQIEPLRDDDLCKMEQRIADLYNCAPMIFVSLTNPWKDMLDRLQGLADDNARLIAEVRNKTANARVERPCAASGARSARTTGCAANGKSE